MSNITIKKEPIVSEDISLGMGTVVQNRGEGNQVNGSNIPYSATETINEAVDRKEDTTTVDSKLTLKADLNGNVNETFAVSPAQAPNDAVARAELDADLAGKADLTYVDTELAAKSDTLNTLLKDGTSAPFTPINDNSPATKLYVDTSIIDAGAGDMLKAVYDQGNTGAVDTTEAIGRTGTFLGQTPMNQVMRLSQSNPTDCDILDDMGIYVGTDVLNAPTSGMIGLEQLSVSGIKAQRCYSFLTNLSYSREYNGTLWSAWTTTAKSADVVQKIGDSMTGSLVMNGATGSAISIDFTTAGVVTGRITKADDDNFYIESFNSTTGVLETSMLLSADGNVSVNGTVPTAVDHLTRKDYVDSSITTATAPKADTTYVDSENAAQDTIIADKAEGKALPHATDINTVVTTGMYLITGAVNAPVSRTTVSLSVQSNGGTVYQTCMDDNQMQVRRSTNNGSSWGSWYKYGSMVLSGTTLTITL